MQGLRFLDFGLWGFSGFGAWGRTWRVLSGLGSSVGILGNNVGALLGFLYRALYNDYYDL